MRDYNAIQFRSPSEKKQALTSSSAMFHSGTGSVGSSSARSTSLSPIPRSKLTVNSGQKTEDGRSSSSNTHTTAVPSTIQSISIPNLSDHPQQQQQHTYDEESMLLQPTTSTVNVQQQQHPTTGIPRFRPSSATLSPIQRPTTTTTTPTGSQTTKSLSNYRSSSPVDTVMSLSPTQSNAPQHQQQHRGNSNSSLNNASTSRPTQSNFHPNDQQQQAEMLSPNDALILRRDYGNNMELYICKLRNDMNKLQAMMDKNSSTQSKSDAIILELRSQIRQYKRQLDKKTTTQSTNNTNSSSTTTGLINDASPGNATKDIISNDATDDRTDSTSINVPNDVNNTNKNAEIVIMELQQQLQDVQHKLNTADLIRKELEDTIEAEQYTWELRVQDLERDNMELKQQVTILASSNNNNNNVASSSNNGSPTNRSKGIGENNDNIVVDDETNYDTMKQQLLTAQNEVQRYRAMIMSSTASAIDNGAEHDINGYDSSNNVEILKEKVLLLEQERQELQGCLDEALKELEAVDLELQQDSNIDPTLLREENEKLQQLVYRYEQQLSSSKGILPTQNMNDDGDTVEQLQHLYRWLLERDGHDSDVSTDHESKVANLYKQYTSIPELIHVIQTHIETCCTTNSQINELQQQISAYKGDLHAKEEDNQEVRNNLKEAVSLLRPLQDNVTKLEKDKMKYQELYESILQQHDAAVLEIRKYKQLINTKDDEIDQMKQDVESLELQLSKAKLVVANNVVTSQQQNNNNNTNRSIDNLDGNIETLQSISSPSDVLDEKRAKRRSGENNLKELLRDAVQSTGDTAMDRELLRKEYEQEITTLRNELSQKESNVQKLKDELNELHYEQKNQSSNTTIEEQAKMLEQAETKIQMLEQEISETKRLLAAKRDAERGLNRSLKDALGLIKPLQMHLEESETEKRQIERELEQLKQQRQISTNGAITGNTHSRSVANLSFDSHPISVEVVRDLETTVRQLEKENAMLHDALEDMSQTLNASHLSDGRSNEQRNNNSVILSPNHRQPQYQQVPEMAKTQESKRLHQEYVELQSRYEVTQTRLNDAYNENHTLSEIVQQQRDEQYNLHKEVSTLRDQLSSNLKGRISEF